MFHLGEMRTIWKSDNCSIKNGSLMLYILNPSRRSKDPFCRYLDHCSRTFYQRTRHSCSWKQRIVIAFADQPSSKPFAVATRDQSVPRKTGAARSTAAGHRSTMSDPGTTVTSHRLHVASSHRSRGSTSWRGSPMIETWGRICIPPLPPSTSVRRSRGSSFSIRREGTKARA